MTTSLSKFRLSDEQELLVTSARKFLAGRYPLEKIAAVADHEGFQATEWRWLAELGWTGISSSEVRGGAGLSFTEELLLVEELGRALYPGPFLATVVLALPALRSVNAFDLEALIVTGQCIATVAWAGLDGEFSTDPAPPVEWDGRRLTGRKRFVPHLGLSDSILVLGSTRNDSCLWWVANDALGVSRSQARTLDGTRPMGDLTLRDAPAKLLGTVDLPLLDSLKARALAALAAEAVGVGSRVLEFAVGHAKARVQFGRQIGSFQAISHPLAQTYVELAMASSLVSWAGWAISEIQADAPVAAAAAKARASDAAVAACERAIQVHGGLGFTWQHPLHRYYRRALAIAASIGSDAKLREQVAARILDQI